MAEQSLKRKRYYLVYTVIFFVTALLCFWLIILSGRSLIWQSDGWNQHIRALVYYARYLRKIVRTLLSDGRLVIPEWDFNIGEGGDILNTLHYYVIGDPVAFLSVFVPTRFMHYFYSASCIFRLYLAGIAFSELCFGTGQRNRYGILAGALSYSFCMWGIYCAARHPYFLNPMIYLPFMILGVEKVIKGEKPYLFIAMVAISAVSNFYFFYMIVLLTVIYVIVRLAVMYRTAIRRWLPVLGRLACYSVMGVMISAIVLLPVMMMALGDSRMSSVLQPFHWFYPLSHYTRLPAIVLSNTSSYYLMLGLTAPAILAVFVLFMDNKSDPLLKALFAVCAVIALFPICGRILNCMSYKTNRWCWAWVLLCAYILAYEWEGILTLSIKRWRTLGACVVLVYGLCLLFARNKATLSTVPLLFITLMLAGGCPLVAADKKNMKAALLVLTAMIGLGNNAFWEFSSEGAGYAKELVKNQAVRENMDKDETELVKSVSDGEYARYSGRYVTENANLLKGISNTQYYWTLSNHYVNEYRSTLETLEPYYVRCWGYDDRTTPNALAAVQYFTVKDDDTMGMPYGYEKVGEDSEQKIAVYKNQYALPIGYCYDEVIPEEEWDSLDPAQKQESLLFATCVDETFEDLAEYDVSSIQDYTIPYEIECDGDKITLTDSGFVTTAKNTKATLTMKAESTDAETYVAFEGLEYTATPEYDLYFGDESVDPNDLYDEAKWDSLSLGTKYTIIKSKLFWNSVANADIKIESSEGIKKNINYKHPEYASSSGKHNFIINLGYMEDGVATITITFPSRGVYSFDSLQVYSIPMDGYAEKIAELQDDILQNVEFEVDGLRGDVEVDSSKLLCIATPYSEGWKGYIDGEEVEVYCVNKHYLGLHIPEGEHSVYLHYETPYKKAGAAVSVLGIFALCGVYLVERKRK